MTVDVRRDHPQRDRAGRLLRRWTTTITGALLVLTGIVAAVCLIPAVFLVIAALGKPADESMFVAPAAIYATTVALIAIMIGGRRVGMRLLRGNRELVLFLRRFGYRDATTVASFAATRTIGRSWRLVTLDDAAVAPVGMASGMTGLLRAGDVATAAAPTLARMGKLLFLLGWWGPAAVFAYAYLQTGTLEPYADIPTTMLDGHLPAQLGEDGLPGAVGAAAVVFAAAMVGAGAIGVAMLVRVFLTPVVAAGGTALAAARTAERSKQLEINTAAEVATVADALAAGSRKVLAPRLVVLRVATEVWQQAVRTLASVGSLTIIDVSEPSENLLWEIEELSDRLGPRCVFIAHHEQIARLTERPADATPADPLAARLLSFLDGREVLAYDTDPDATRRFARALQAKLLDVAAPRRDTDRLRDQRQLEVR